MLNRCVLTSRSKTVIITLGLMVGFLLVIPVGVWAQAVETPTETPVVIPTETPTAIPPTMTPVPPTSTPKPVETATETPTAVPPTNTPVPPTPTSKPIETATETPTVVPPTNTPVPPTPTLKPVETATETPTAIPPTNTPVPPTPTETTIVTPTQTPTPQPTPTPTKEVVATPTPYDFENPHQGIAILDGFGGLHELGDVMRLTDINGDGKISAAERIPLFPYVAGRDVYRDLNVYLENGKVKAVLAVRGDGKVYSAQINENGTVKRGYLPDLGLTFPSVNDVVDAEFLSNGMGYFVLLADGTLISVDQGGVQKVFRVKTDKTGVGAGAIDARKNPAVDLEIVKAETSTAIPSAYILDARGFIHPLGDAVPLFATTSNSPIFIGMELVPDQQAAVIADGYGRFYQALPKNAAPLDIVLPELGFGRAEPVLVDFDLQKDANVQFSQGIGIVAMTKYGTLHTSGAADFLLTESGLANWSALMNLPEGVYPRIDKNLQGKYFLNIGIVVDILHDLELYQVGN